MDDRSTNFALLAMVLIVALVSLVFMFRGTNTQAVAGKAYMPGSSSELETEYQIKVSHPNELNQYVESGMISPEVKQSVEKQYYQALNDPAIRNVAQGPSGLLSICFRYCPLWPICVTICIDVI